MNPLTSIEKKWAKLSNKEKLALGGGGILLLAGVVYLKKGGKVPSIANRPSAGAAGATAARPSGYGGGSVPGASSNTSQTAMDNGLAIAQLNAQNVATQIAANERIAQIRAKQATDTAWINAGAANARASQSAAQNALRGLTGGDGSSGSRSKQKDVPSNYLSELSKLFNQDVEDDQLLRDIDRILEDEGPFGFLIPGSGEDGTPEGSVSTASEFSFDVPDPVGPIFGAPVDTDYTRDGFFTQWSDGNENVGFGPSYIPDSSAANDFSEWP